MSSDPQAAPVGPGFIRKAVNFGNAVARFVSKGGKQVDDATHEQRLDICRACELCNLEQMLCRHNHCGCRLVIKARWATESCPLGKWTQQTAAPEPQNAEPEPPTDN